MTLRLVHTSPVKPATELLVREILAMWATRRFDTKSMADLLKISEATVYNTLHAYREAKRIRGAQQ